MLADSRDPLVALPVKTQGRPSRWRRFTEAAGRVLEAPVVCLSLVDANHRLVTSSYGLSAPMALLLSWPFMTQVIASRRTLVITDGRTDARVALDPAMRDAAVRAYVGMQLLASDGCAVGVLSVIDSKPRLWGGPQLEFLGDLSARIVGEVERTSAWDGKAEPQPYRWVPSPRELRGA